MDFNKYSKEQLGEAYKQIVGYNPFEDDADISKEEVIELMKGYDQAIAEEGSFGGTTFEQYFSSIKDENPVGKKAAIVAEKIIKKESDSSAVKKYKDDLLKKSSFIFDIISETAGTFTLKHGKTEIRVPRDLVLILEDQPAKASNENLVKEIREKAQKILLPLKVGVKVSDAGNTITIEPSDYSRSQYKSKLDGMQIIYDLEKQEYEVSEYQAGPNKDELHIYKETPSLTVAIKDMLKGNGRKPIKIWDNDQSHKGAKIKGVDFAKGGKITGTATWWDFMPYRDAQLLSESVKRMNEKEVRSLLDNKRKKWEHSMTSPSEKRRLRDEVWQLEKLISAYEKANDYNIEKSKIESLPENILDSSGEPSITAIQQQYYHRVSKALKTIAPNLELWKNFSIRDKDTNLVYRVDSFLFKRVGGKLQEIVFNYVHGQSSASIGELSIVFSSDEINANFESLGINKIEKFAWGGMAAKGGRIKDNVMQYGESIAEELIKNYLPDVKPNEVYQPSQLIEKGQYCLYEEKSRDFSDQCCIEVFCGDDYIKLNNAINSNYETFSSFLEKIADRKNFNSEILTSDENETITFVLTNPRTSKFAWGGMAANVIGEKRARDIAKYFCEAAEKAGKEQEVVSLFKFAKEGFSIDLVLPCKEELNNITFRVALEDILRLRYYFDQFIPSKEQAELMKKNPDKFARGGNVLSEKLIINPEYKYQNIAKRWLEDNDENSLRYKIAVMLLNNEHNIDEKLNININLDKDYDRYLRILRGLASITESKHEMSFRTNNVSIANAEIWAKEKLNEMFVLSDSYAKGGTTDQENPLSYYVYETPRITILWNDIEQPLGRFVSAVDAAKEAIRIGLKTGTPISNYKIKTPDGVLDIPQDLISGWGADYERKVYDNPGGLWKVVGKKNGQFVDITELPMSRQSCFRWIKDQGVEKHYTNVGLVPYRGSLKEFKYNKGGLTDIFDKTIGQALYFLETEKDFSVIEVKSRTRQDRKYDVFDSDSKFVKTLSRNEVVDFAKEQGFKFEHGGKVDYSVGDTVSTKRFSKGIIQQIDTLDRDIDFDGKKVKKGEKLYKVIDKSFPQSSVTKGGWFISSEISKYSKGGKLNTKFDHGGSVSVQPGDRVAFKDTGSIVRIDRESGDLMVRDASGNTQSIPRSRILEKFKYGGISRK